MSSRHYTSNYATEEALKNARDAEISGKKATDHIPNTEYEYNEERGYYMLTHTKGGNVFAGSMGRLYALDGKTVLDSWQSLGKVKSTKLTITGGTIKSNVYGGGELAKVDGRHNDDHEQNVSTEITINGDHVQIGSVINESVTVTPEEGEPISTGVPRYTFGSVYGGGSGSTEEELVLSDGETKTYPKLDAGIVKDSTKVSILDGTVLASVYGGGEVASVNGSTYVAVKGGTIGHDKVGSGLSTSYFGGATMGNVYGGGSGHRNIVRAGHIFGNTKVNITEANGKTTRIYHKYIWWRCLRYGG